MPGTQHDALVWLSGSAYDVIFDMARSVVHDLAGQATLGEETSSWSYRHDRDLTGFIDGSENPTLLDAPSRGTLARRSSRRCRHSPVAAKVEAQGCGVGSAADRAAGAHHGTHQARQHRTREKPADSHVARTDQDEFGHIFRRNMPYGSVADHGTMFVGFSADQKRLRRMLDSMAGLVTGTRDALTRFTQPLTGSYYFVPSVESLRAMQGEH